MKQPKIPSKRDVALARAKIAGFENDKRTFTRLIVESRVNRQEMNEAWLRGIQARKHLEDLEIAEEIAGLE